MGRRGRRRARLLERRRRGAQRLLLPRRAPRGDQAGRTRDGAPALAPGGKRAASARAANRARAPRGRLRGPPPLRPLQLDLDARAAGADRHRVRQPARQRDGGRLAAERLGVGAAVLEAAGGDALCHHRRLCLDHGPRPLRFCGRPLRHAAAARAGVGLQADAVRLWRRPRRLLGLLLALGRGPLRRRPPRHARRAVRGARRRAGGRKGVRGLSGGARRHRAVARPVWVRRGALRLRLLLLLLVALVRADCAHRLPLCVGLRPRHRQFHPLLHRLDRGCQRAAAAALPPLPRLLPRRRLLHARHARRHPRARRRGARAEPARLGPARRAAPRPPRRGARLWVRHPRAAVQRGRTAPPCAGRALSASRRRNRAGRRRHMAGRRRAGRWRRPQRARGRVGPRGAGRRGRGRGGRGAGCGGG
mmetsp:Transcript_4830/g.15433  ORF Transcript_4830/g.15433 Transcript_4830/m.15433 type:complete len:419 (-) Transcript_4830:1161-2417(-)